MTQVAGAAMHTGRPHVPGSTVLAAATSANPASAGMAGTLVVR